MYVDSRRVTVTSRKTRLDLLGLIHADELPCLKTRIIPPPLLLEAFLLTRATFLTHHFPLAVHRLCIFSLAVT